MALWALVMAVTLFCLTAHVADRAGFIEIALISTSLLGLYLGWHRRSGTVVIAPFVSWMLAWPGIVLGSMIHDGFIKGFFKGLFLITFGWIAIGGAEFSILLIMTSITRILRGPRSQNEPDVTIFGPDDVVK